MATVDAALVFVNQNLRQLLPCDRIAALARQVGHRWRRRKLGPDATIVLLVMQLLRGNASLAEARAHSGHAVSVSALAKARQRLPLALLQQLSAWLIEQFIGTVVAADVSPPARVLLVDAGNYYTPDTPQLRRRYRQPRQKQRGGDYPQLRTLCVFDLHSGLMLQQHDFASDRSESPQLRKVLDRLGLRRGDVLVFDRGFVSYANIALLIERGVHVVARLARNLHARRGSRRTRAARLGKNDALVCWRKPPRGRGNRAAANPPTLWRRLPERLSLRQITLAAADSKGSRCRRITLITTLSDARTHPAAQLAQWYRRRWEIETNFRHLKSTLKLEFLRTKSVNNVRRELLLRMIAYNLVRVVMLKATARRQSDAGRISFADACRWLLLSPMEGVSLLKLLINPARQRRGRVRKLKYRGKNYRLLTTRPARQKKAA